MHDSADARGIAGLWRFFVLVPSVRLCADARRLVGISAGEFRRRFDGVAMLERFRANLIDPYRETLRTFDPLTESQGERAKTRRWEDSPHSGQNITGSAA
jgi:hypothetical protein